MSPDHDHPQHHHDGAEIETIDVRAAHDLAAQGVLLVDVREQHEWDAGHAPAAVHLPMSAFDLSRLTPDRTLLICRSGNRSGHVAAALAPAGFDMVNVVGGMLAWEDAGLPMVASGEHVDDEPTVA